jgi:hypothetical protein
VPVRDKRQRDERCAAPSHLLHPDNAHSLHPLYNTTQYGIARCKLSNLLVNSASYSASSFSFIDVCTEGGVQGLWYYVYGTSPLASVVGAILMLVNDPHIARVFVELQLFYELQLCRTQVYFQNSSQVQDFTCAQDLSCGRAELKRTGLKFVSGGTMGTGALYSGVGDSEELKFRGTYECGGG